MKQVSMEMIDTERFPNARTVMDPSSIRSLADSIARHSLLQPVVLTGGNTGDGRYYLVAGFRRLAAYRLLGRKTIPAIVKRMPVNQAPMVQLAENMDREPLPLLDESAALARLRDDNTLSVAELADLCGKSQGYITQRISISRLPGEVHEAFLDGKIQFSDLRDIAGVKGKDREAAQIAALRAALGDAAKPSAPAKPGKPKESATKKKARTRTAVRKRTREAGRQGQRPGTKASEGTVEERLEAFTEKMIVELAQEMGATTLPPTQKDVVRKLLAKLQNDHLLVLP